MSGIGGIGNDPFSPKQSTTPSPIFPIIPIQTSTSTPTFVITPTPISSLPPLTLSTEIVTKTKLDPSLPAISTVSSGGTNTLTLAVPEGQGRNNNDNSNNTISTAAIIFSIMIGFVIVGGCITLIFTRKKHPENKKKRTNVIQRNLYGEDSHESNESNERIVVRPINSISPPLNLPPPPPQRSPRPPSFSSPRNSLPLPPIPQFPQFPSPPQHLPPASPSPPPTPEHSPPQPLPPIPQHSPIILYRNPSLKRNGSKNNYDFNISEDYYQRYSQLRPPSPSPSANSASSYINVEDPPMSKINEPP